MTTTYTEKESSRKKYLAPLVVIMLCLVAITGAAYAYSTSVTGNGNIAGNYVVIDMYSSADDNAGTAKFNVDSNAVKVYAETDKTGTPYDYKGFVEENTKLTFSTYVKINTNLAATQKFKLTQLTADTGTIHRVRPRGKSPVA